MNSRALLSFASRVAPRMATKNCPRLMSSDHYTEPYKPSTLDEMPVPQGSWKAEYDRRSQKGNIHIALGVTAFILTVGFMAKSEKIFFNFFYPELPPEMFENKK